MSTAAPGLFVLSDKLEWPPRLGFQIHLHSLIRAVSPHVPTHGYCWASPAAELPETLVRLDPASAPQGWYSRKRWYLARAFDHLDRAAAPGSLAWVRDYSTALLSLRRLRRRRSAGIRNLFDASSFLRLEAPTAPNPFATRMRGMVEEWLWPRFDMVRTLNDPMRDYLIRHGVPAERILVVPVGAAPQAQRWRPHESARRLLYVGSASLYQGLPALIGAMRILVARAPRIELSVVGPSADELAGLAPPANVRLLARVPHSAMGQVYLEHDLLVLSRPRTPLTELVTPMKIPEAMAFGMPILSTDVAAIRWTTGDDGAFLVRDDSPEGLAAAAERALGDPAALAATAARAWERSVRFRWDEIGRTIAARLFT